MLSEPPAPPAAASPDADDASPQPSPRPAAEERRRRRRQLPGVVLAALAVHALLVGALLEAVPGGAGSLPVAVPVTVYEIPAESLVRGTPPPLVAAEPAPEPPPPSPPAPTTDAAAGSDAAAPGPPAYDAGDGADIPDGMEMPVPLQTPRPLATAAAIAHGVDGSVGLEILVARDGMVASVRVLEGLPYGLTDAAVRAVRGWVFRPATLDGMPVDVAVRIRVGFDRPGDAPAAVPPPPQAPPAPPSGPAGDGSPPTPVR